MSKSFKDDFRTKEQRGNTSRRPRQVNDSDIEFIDLPINFRAIIDLGTRKMQKAQGKRVSR